MEHFSAASIKEEIGADEAKFAEALKAAGVEEKETYSPWETLMVAAAYADLVLADIKASV